MSKKKWLQVRWEPTPHFVPLCKLVKLTWVVLIGYWVALMVLWLVAWLVGWLFGWSKIWLVGDLVGWLVGGAQQRTWGPHSGLGGWGAILIPSRRWEFLVPIFVRAKGFKGPQNYNLFFWLGIKTSKAFSTLDPKVFVKRIHIPIQRLFPFLCILFFQIFSSIETEKWYLDFMISVYPRHQK